MPAHFYLFIFCVVWKTKLERFSFIFFSPSQDERLPRLPNLSLVDHHSKQQRDLSFYQRRGDRDCQQPVFRLGLRRKLRHHHRCDQDAFPTDSVQCSAVQSRCRRLSDGPDSTTSFHCLAFGTALPGLPKLDGAVLPWRDFIYRLHFHFVRDAHPHQLWPTVRAGATPAVSCCCQGDER